MTDYVSAWQCIGCGKIDAPQPCIGICQDHKIRLVYAQEHELTLAALATARQRVNALEAFARRVAGTNPRKDRWEHSYRVMQEHARALLAPGAAHGQD